MEADGLTMSRPRLRGTDSNSLLRLYDLANERLGACQTPQQRDLADKAVRRIADELRRRQVRH
jgi:hypothetical protein